MTYTEIIEKLKTLYDKVDYFAYNESVSIPKDFIFSEKIEIGAKLKEELKLQVEAHPEYGISSKDWSKDYKLLYEKYYNTPSKWTLEENEYLDSIGIGGWKEVDSTGGMDEGSNWTSTKYFHKHDIYIKVQGYYQSHHGTDFYDEWDSCSEVRPVEKTIIVYE